MGEYRHCQVAIDGIPSIPFDVHEADFLGFASNEKLYQFLARQGMSLIERFGDARCQPAYESSRDRLPS